MANAEILISEMMLRLNVVRGYYRCDELLNALQDNLSHIPGSFSVQRLMLEFHSYFD